jgi:hypothetical protein
VSQKDKDANGYNQEVRIHLQNAHKFKEPANPRHNYLSTNQHGYFHCEALKALILRHHPADDAWR